MMKYNLYTIQKFGFGKDFNVFERSILCSSRLRLFDQKYSKKKSNIVKYYCNQYYHKYY